MTKKRRYLKDLIPININKLVLETGYYELQIGDKLLSLAPDRCPDGSYVISLFVNHLRQPKTWELSARPHLGRLKYAQIPYSHDEVYYVIGTDGRRYRHLFIDAEEKRIGVRTDFFKSVNDAYPRGKAREANKTFREQIEEMDRVLFPAEKDEIYRWDQDYKRRRNSSKSNDFCSNNGANG